MRGQQVPTTPGAVRQGLAAYRSGHRTKWGEALRFAAVVWGGWARIVASGWDVDVAKREVALMEAAQAAVSQPAPPGRGALRRGALLGNGRKAP